MNILTRLSPHWIKKTYWAHVIWSKYNEYKIRRTYVDHVDTFDSTAEHTVIYTINNPNNKAGLSDRLWGLIATYIICKKNGIDFKVNWCYPFNLEEFLIPNKYDWHIDQKDIVYDKRYATPIFVSNNQNKRNQLRLLERAIKPNTPQVHMHAVAHIDNNKFGEYFNYLFKPSPLLQQRLNHESELIGSRYVSVTFRFQQLLGDFKEGNYHTLDVDSQRKLIESSIQVIKNIRKRNPNIAKVLVTSDSKTILEEASKLDYVHTIKGDLVHMGYSSDSDTSKHIKAFVDFLMIAKAEKVYFVKSKEIYSSTFASTASKIFKRPYEIINISI